MMQNLWQSAYKMMQNLWQSAYKYIFFIVDLVKNTELMILRVMILRVINDF